VLAPLQVPEHLLQVLQVPEHLLQVLQVPEHRGGSRPAGWRLAAQSPSHQRVGPNRTSM